MAEYNSFRVVAVRILNFLRKPAGLIIAVFLILMIPYLLKYLGREPLVLPPPPTERALGLQEFINAIKGELVKMEKDRTDKNEAAVFDITGIDLEISFIVRTSAQQKSGVEYQVVTAESQIQNGMERVQKLTMHLKQTPPQQIQSKLVNFPSNSSSGAATSEGSPPSKE
jgi:hypothetical protein